MDNKQLKIFLRNYERQLSKAIEAVEGEIPEEMREKYKDILGYDRERIPVLEELYKLQEELYSDIKELD